MIRQKAFIDADKKMLKGALHCHTTRSDGKLTPEELLSQYHANNYDFVAITDHDKYNFQNFTPELPITVIPGMEANIKFFTRPGPDGISGGRRHYHIVCLGPAKEDGNGFEQDEMVYIPKEAITTEFGPQKSSMEAVQRFLDDVYAKGNIAFYCHPQWSCTPSRYFDGLKGLFAMEVWNTHCAITLDIDNDAPCWNDVLNTGKMIYGVAVDDCHPARDLGGGWVRVNAENNINAILEALKNGAFYASNGPEIYDFYYDADAKKVVVECSPAAEVQMYRGYGMAELQTSEAGDLTHVEFETGNPGWVRISVADKNGKRAWTNPIGTSALWADQ